jgi:hypothetical protein
MTVSLLLVNLYLRKALRPTAARERGSHTRVGASTMLKARSPLLGEVSSHRVSSE